jgi:3-oxoadipate enol-lactonase
MPAPLLHHRIDGDGPRAVLLHPIGLDFTCFDALVTELSPRFRLLRPDLRGHGLSRSVAPSTALSDYADDVHRLIEALSFGPAAVVGFSFGGMIAQVLALTHPDVVRALVVSACPGTLSDEGRQMMTERAARAERDGIAAALDETMTRWFTEEFRRRGGDEPVRRRLLGDDVHAWAQAWRAIAALDAAPQLHAIRVPTLCLAGEADVASPPHVVQAIAERIPGARFAVVPSAPHMLFIEQPQEVARRIAEFLTEHVVR